MPKVGKRSFSYTKKGQAAAKKYAKKAGMSVKTAPFSASIIGGASGGKKG